MKTLVEFYNERFKSGNGGNNLVTREVIWAAQNLLPKGRALDIGSGMGKNALFLAEQGFDVEAVDISPVGINILKRASQKKGLTIHTRLGHMSDLGIKGDFQLIICIFVIMHFSKEKALALIADMQTHTLPGGMNVFVLYNDYGHVANGDPFQEKYYPPVNEIFNLYAGWDIIYHDVEYAEMNIVTYNQVTHFIARKPV